MDVREIPLNFGRVALIDGDDFERIGTLHWFCTKTTNIYACRNIWRDGRSRRVLMHRLILSAPSHLLVDHINGDGLDNRRSNLRLCTPSENLRNKRKRSNTMSSQFKGVCFDKRSGRWTAAIGLGTFKTEEEAAKAYDHAASLIFGDFALINFERVA